MTTITPTQDVNHPTADDLLAPSLPGLATNRVEQLLAWAAEERAAVHLVGPHGIGKTAFVRAWARQQGLRVVERSLPVCTTRDFCVPVPVGGAGGRRLEVLVLEELLQRHPDDRYVLVLDEFSRADRSTFNTAMELLSERTIAGQPLPGLAAVVALDNPVDDGDYDGIGQLDLAQADRLASLQVDADDIPWRSYLKKVHRRDLTRLFAIWRRLDRSIRRVLCPRVLDHLITLVVAGFPAEWALPLTATERTRLVDADGTDVTAVVLDELAHHIREAEVSDPEGETPARFTAPTSDNPEYGRPARTEIGPTAVGAVLRTGIDRGWRLRLVGPPGVGKTSHVRQVVADAGYALEYLSLSTTSLSDLVVPVPMNGRLAFLPAARLVTPGRRYVLVLDEFSRAPRDVAAAAMELVNERTLAGQPLPGCIAVIALDNPVQVGTHVLDTGRIDAAQASRFTATLTVDEDDLPWREVLAERFGAPTLTFLDWRAEDLDDTARQLVSPRCVERLLSLHAAGIDLELGLPVLAGERVPVSLAALRRRLDEGTSRGLAALVADLDLTIAGLIADDPRTQLAVLHALQTSEVGALERERPAVIRLLAALAPNHRLALLRTEARRRRVLTAALSQLTRSA